MMYEPGSVLCIASWREPAVASTRLDSSIAVIDPSIGLKEVTAVAAAA
jgi:hypothetical protein